MMDRDIVFSTHIRDANFAEIRAVFIEDFDDAPCGIDITTLFIDVYINALPQNDSTVFRIILFRGCRVNGFLDDCLISLADIVVGQCRWTILCVVNGSRSLRIRMFIRFGRSSRRHVGEDPIRFRWRCARQNCPTGAQERFCGECAIICLFYTRGLRINR